MKFIIDGMLGKLARWLRMLGHDVEYSVKLDDAKLLATAKKERRILLTRDFRLYEQAIAKNIEALYIQGRTEEEKLTEVATRFGIEMEIDMASSRCPKCNTQVKSIPKGNIVDKVPENTLTYYSEFWQCPKCGQIYWKGAHWTKIKKTLENAKQMSQDLLHSQDQNDIRDNIAAHTGVSPSAHGKC